MIIRRFKNHVTHLREQSDEVRWRAATRWTMASGGILALLWVAILLPVQIRSKTNNQDSTAPQSAGVVQGAQDRTRAITPKPTPVVQQYHGTRPTQREATDISPYTLVTPTPTPTPTPTISASPSVPE